MDKDLIKEASSKLSVLDVYIINFHLDNDKNFHPSMFSNLDEVEYQSRKEIKYKKAKFTDELDNIQHLLVVEAVLGIRAAHPTTEEDQSTEKPSSNAIYTLEAAFRAEYSMAEDNISEEAIKEFSLYNGLHTIWPFWRQFVFDMIPRARLPIPEIPLMTPLKTK